MKSIFFAGLLWLGMVGGQLVHAAPADEPTNMWVSPEDGTVRGDFKLCSAHYMTHLWRAGNVDDGLFEVVAYGYYFGGRCVLHVLPSSFNDSRSLVIGVDGRSSLLSAVLRDVDGVALTPYQQGDAQPVTRFGVIFIGKRILRLKLIPDAATNGGYRFGGLVYLR